MQIGTTGTDKSAALLSSSQQLGALNRPTASEYRSVCRYIDQTKPLIDEELEYIQHRDDLVTLRSGSDSAWLDRSAEHVLRWLPFFLFDVSISGITLCAVLSSNA